MIAYFRIFMRFVNRTIKHERHARTDMQKLCFYFPKNTACYIHLKLRSGFKLKYAKQRHDIHVQVDTENMNNLRHPFLPVFQRSTRTQFEDYRIIHSSKSVVNTTV